MNKQTSPFDLTGKVVLVTGGAGFLGERFSHALAAAGAKVALTYHSNKDKAEDLVGQLGKQYGTEAMAISMDVANKKSVVKGFGDAIEAWGTVDVVINNAALDPKFDADADKNDKLFENYPEELLQQSLDVNLKGYVLVAQEAVKHMLPPSPRLRGTRKGHIINIASIYGLVGPDQGIYPEGTQKPVDYAITKGGIVMLTKWLATTYGPKGIRANTYTLGGVFKGHDKEFVKKYGARTPLGRMADPDEVGGPLVFLASDASNYMSGANLVVDGGWTAW